MGSSISVQVTGFVGSEPLVKEVGEQRVVSFSLAVNRKTSNGKQQTLWVRVNAWNGLGDVVIKYVRKSSLIQCETNWLRPSAWIDQNGEARVSLDLDASRITLLDRVEVNEQQPERFLSDPYHLTLGLYTYSLKQLGNLFMNKSNKLSSTQIYQIDLSLCTYVIVIGA